MNNLGNLRKYVCIVSRKIAGNYTANNMKFFSTEAAKYETLSVTVPKPFVFHVELNRPEKRNAMNSAMWVEIKNCFESLSLDEECRVIVLSGAGKLFCAGIDMSAFMDMGSKMTEPIDVARKCKFIFNGIQSYQASLSALEKCVKPVIAAIHGNCIGAGLDMIVAADIRFCTTDAVFCAKEVDIGLAPDVGTLQRLPRTLGNASLARELVFTGRNFPAEEAKENGLVSRVFDSREKLIEGSIETAANIASKSPVAVQTAKRSLVFSANHNIQDGLDHIALLNSTMLQSEDVMTAIVANATKSPEPPAFSKL